MITQGETLEFEIVEYADRDKTIPKTNVGYAAKMQARPTVDSDEILFELTDGSGLTLQGANGVIKVRISALITAGITSIGVYDVRLTNTSDSTDVRYPIEISPMTFKKRVTR